VSAPFSLPERYRLDGPVAAGGMASVWAAHDTLLDRPVAVKVLAEHLGEDLDARERFQREARAAAALSSHPNVVTIFDVGEHEGRSFIVMELCRGGTLGDVLRKDGRVAPERALGWLRSAADALDAAHAAGVVHRDIKPANLLLDEHDRLAVADFGIARLAYENQVTATGQILGTASYISPEQAAGDPATEASDRYALAVVAFELLTGERPFSAEHFAAQARAHIEDPPPRASERVALPAGVDEVLMRGMNKDPAARWPSASAFVDALDDAFEERTAATRMMAASSTPVAPMPAPRAAAPRVAAAPPPRAPSRPLPPPHRDRGGNRALVILGSLIAVVALIALAAVALGGGDDPPADQKASAPTEKRSTKPKRKATPTPAAAQKTPQAQSSPPPATDAGGDLATARRANDQGFALFNAGKYAEAVPFFQQAVESCGTSDKMDPCGYALYNLGASMNRAGDPAGAIPVLERRLSEFGDNSAGDVQRELDDARLAMAGGGAPQGNGKAKGKAKKDKSDNGD
jgi:serine/threonine-protein kinase